MREIKFRGKTQDGKWLYGDLMHDNIGGCYIYPIESENLYKENAVIPDTIGQFTGLKDKNEKDIYEGDRVQQYWGYPHYRKGVYYDCYSRIGTVVFESCQFLLKCDDGLYRLYGDGLTQEVIGDIWHTPNDEGKDVSLDID
jgi:uncharacterized phage protein (TIGR01671 family)